MLNAVIGGRKPSNFKAGMSRIAPALFLLGALLSALGMAEIFGGPQAAFGQSAPESVSSQTVSATLDYRHHKTCDMLGGRTETALDIAGKTAYICSEIDRVDTFCIVGHPVAQPCQGLFKHVVACNDKYNRPAENMFFCAEKCPDGYFACGNQCGHHGAINPPGRILYVPETYRGEIFRPTANVTLGMAKFRVEPSDSVMTVSDAGGMTMAVGVHAAALAAGEYSATLRADFSCAGLAQESATVAADYYSFTITVFSPPPTLTIYFEAGDGEHDGGQPSIPGIKQLSLEGGNIHSGLRIAEGIIQYPGTRLSVGSFLTITASGHSPEFLGSLALEVRAEFYHPLNPIFGPDHCSPPDNQRELRQAAGCDSDPSCQPNENLLKSISDQFDSLFCQALREGADVSVAITEKNASGFVIRHESPLLFALSVNRLDLAQTLTLNGARLDQYDDFEGGGLLNYAAFYGSTIFARWLLDKVKQDPNRATGDNARLNPLHRLAQRDLGDDGDAAAVAQMLIDNHADPNAETDGWAHPGIGVYRSDAALRAINIMTQDRPGGRPPDHRWLPIMLSNGLDASYASPDREGRLLLPLSHAAENNYVHVISLLADASHVNRRNPGDGGLPLHYASSPEAVDLLLDGGASLNYAPDMQGSTLRGWTPLDAMVEWHLTTTLALTSAAAERQLDGLLHLNRLGGQCNQNRAPGTNGSALCLTFSALAPEVQQSGPSSFSSSFHCMDPELTGGTGSRFYESACYAECKADGYDPALIWVHYCRKKAVGTAEDFRDLCEREAYADLTGMGLSCGHVKWRPSNTGGN